MALPLPDTIFSEKPTPDISIPVGSDVGDSIDSGQLDLTPLLEETNITPPSDTIKGAPESFYQQQAQQQAAVAEQQSPNKEGNDQLDKIEAAISNIDKKINSLKMPAQVNQQQPSPEVKSKIDENLVKNETDDGGIVEVVKKESTVTNRNEVSNRSTFTKEKMNELLEQRNMLVQERQKILSAGIMNNLTNNQTTAFNNKEEVNQGPTSTSNTSNTDINSPVTQNTTSVENAENISNASAVTDNSSAESIINQQQDNSQVFNESLSQVENTSITPGVAESPITNIENRTTGDTFNENNIANSTTVLPEAENETSDLPSPKSELNENSQNIAQILNGIKQGIDSLPEKLGSNFQRLGSSLEGLKSTVINNQYNNSQSNSFAGSQGAPSQGGSQRSTMPDYNTELPNSNDFPPNFDLASLGGTNLPNPQFIT